LRRLRKSRRPSPALSAVVRGAAVTALAAAVAVPLVRRRFRIHPAVTAATVASGPFALAVLRPRTRARDAALYALQMWGFVMAHELPYDDPESLRRRLKVRYPIATDRALGLGRLPNVRLQRALSPAGEVTAKDHVLTWVHWLWFFQPHLALVWILARDQERFPRAARQMSATFDVGCLGYVTVPTAPPWWASDEGYTGDERVRRIMVDVGEEFWGRAWPALYGSLGGNPWAAMPSLHFATSLMAALLLSESGRSAGAVGWAYAASLGFALVYLGEHYVTDLAAGAALVALVRRGEPLAEPVALGVSALAQRLERLANP
jgi:membrane-associated phospholipid phosphatase